jgi:probable potassium transport system protein kup
MGNFVFVLINRIYSTFASFSFKERLIMDAYEWIDHLKLSITRSLGLNTSNVLIENVPLTLKSHAKKVGNSIPRVERIEENGGFH